MIYGSVCSGIEAASAAWEPLGWRPAWFAEIEAFPSAVLHQRFPGVPNLGDFTTIGKDDGPIDILVGGTPCQSFSVAGKRAGLDDPRGNLTLEFARKLKELRPRRFIWENVPGILSIDKGETLRSFLDIIEGIGYVIDVDILDAQFFGVPQRRRRVIVCGQHRSDLLKKKTNSSALTIAQCLQEILHGILAEACKEFGRWPASSASPSLSRDGIGRRMKLFGIHGGDEDCWPTLRENLIAACRRSLRGLKKLDASLGGEEKGPTQDAPSMVSAGERPCSPIEESLSSILDEAFQVMKSFITSTGKNTITTSQIYTCSQAVLLIARLIAHA